VRVKKLEHANIKKAQKGCRPEKSWCFLIVLTGVYMGGFWEQKSPLVFAKRLAFELYNYNYASAKTG